jgi:hypothetical protein
MNDRELLNFAATAADLAIEWRQGWDGTESPKSVVSGCAWNPLMNDSDAFRLAVKLEIEFSSSYDAGMNSYAGYSLEDDLKYVIEPNGADPYAAARRAIVRAAAELGKVKP